MPEYLSTGASDVPEIVEIHDMLLQRNDCEFLYRARKGGMHGPCRRQRQDKRVIGIVIVAHGGLAREYLAATEHVVGSQRGIRAIAIEPYHDRAKKQDEICAAADCVDSGEGVVVVTDMFGGSPCNLSLQACVAENRRIIYGANLPMLVKLAKSRHLGVEDAVARALDAGRKYINCCSGAGN